MRLTQLFVRRPTLAAVVLAISTMEKPRTAALLINSAVQPWVRSRISSDR